MVEQDKIIIDSLVEAIKKGDMTLEQVPQNWRERVAQLLQ